MLNIKAVRKAVFPVAGMGTRFLPATKASPKEMLPIVDKPLIQYAVEEAIASGIRELIFVTSGSKRAIEDHFDSNQELEALLEEKGKEELLKMVRDILPSDVSCVYLRQPKMLGLGHAVLCAKPAVGHEPFAVFLADDLVQGDIPCMRELLDVYETEGASVIGVEPVQSHQTKSYGIIDPKGKFSGKYVEMKGVVEKPKPEHAPSSFGIIGRYVLTPRIFRHLESTEAGAGGEIQLTDAIARLMKEESVYASRFSGHRYDCGNKLGYLHATLEFALEHPEVADDFKTLLLEVAERVSGDADGSSSAVGS